MWLLATATNAAAVTTLPPTWASTRSGAGATDVDDLLVAICATALAAALGWLWLVTTTTVVGLVTGRARSGGTTRRLVLLACGVAVVAGTSVPAFATGGDGRELLAGLSLPERAVAPLRHHQGARPQPEAEVGTGLGLGLRAPTSYAAATPCRRSRSPTSAPRRSTTGGGRSGGPTAASSATTRT